MNPRVKDVKPNRDYSLTITFTNGEVKLFDMKPYLDKGIFRELQDPGVFNSVRPFLGSIRWQNGADLCPDTLYQNSIALPADSSESSARPELAAAGQPVASGSLSQSR